MRKKHNLKASDEYIQEILNKYHRSKADWYTQYGANHTNYSLSHYYVPCFASSSKIISIGMNRYFDFNPRVFLSRRDIFGCSSISQILIFYTGKHDLPSIKRLVDIHEINNPSLTVFALPSEFKEIRDYCGTKHYKLNGSVYFTCNIYDNQRDKNNRPDLHIANYEDRIECLKTNSYPPSFISFDQTTAYKNEPVLKENNNEQHTKP